MKLSVVIPVYNEVAYIERIIQRVKAVNIDKEIIIVDDCSTDGTRQLIENMNGDDGIRVFFHEKNQGKGSALRTAFKQIKGDIVIIQDADMEYDPQDYHKLLKPIIEGKADIVYGSRFLNSKIHCRKFFYITHFWGNKFLNFVTNTLYNAKVTDMETCYKLIKKDILNQMTLVESRFDIEPAITANLLRRGYKIYEVPISYNPRDYKEGKKISWRDAVSAIYVLLKYRFKRFSNE